MSEESGTYKGALGAFPYAFRTSSSRLFKSYVLIAGLLGALLVIFFLLALPGWFASSVNRSATVTLSRAFLAMIFLGVGAPIVTPVLLVARRHRRGDQVAPAYDTAIAGAGYLFVLTLYVGLIIATPAVNQQPVSGILAPVATFLYDLPRVLGAIPPILAVILLIVLHRRLRE